MLCMLAFTVHCCTLCDSAGLSCCIRRTMFAFCHRAAQLTAAKFVPAMLSTMESAMMSPRLVSRVRTTEDGEPSSSTAVWPITCIVHK